MTLLANTTGYVLEVIHALRVELGFLVTFMLLWGASRLFCERPNLRNSKATAAKRHDALGADGGGAYGASSPPAKRHSSMGRARHAGDFQHPTAAQLRQVDWVLAAVQHFCRLQAPRAVVLYREALQAGLEVQEAPEAVTAQLFMVLVTSSIRAGLIDDAFSLLRDCHKVQGVTPALLTSCIKLCTSKQYFKECLSIYDFGSKDAKVLVKDPTVWSCLLFSAVETRSYRRCVGFYEQLQRCGTPSGKDCTNMLRCAFAEGDWKLALGTTQKMLKAGLDIDSVAYNTALATCVAANKISEARALLELMELTDGIADVVTYNTLSKGYAKAGCLDECFALTKHMKSKGITPSQVTYGILLDCCINEKQMEMAHEVFNEMVAGGLPMNTVLYTTLIKGFARGEEVDQAMQVYRQMCSNRETGAPPDLITFSILIKANCDAGRMEDALALLKAMREAGICPDEVVFNSLLGGCIREAKPELAKHLYSTMVVSGVKPSNATFSIFIRLYAQSKLFDEALEMLRTEPKAHNVEPEARLFVQLAQACLRERQGRRAIQAYTLLLSSCTSNAATHSSLLNMCCKLNMLDTAVEILELAAASRGRVSASDVMQLRDITVRKRKTACTEAIDRAAATLGLSNLSA